MVKISETVLTRLNKISSSAKNFINFDLKMGVKINSRIIMKTHATDPEKGFLTKSI